MYKTVLLTSAAALLASLALAQAYGPPTERGLAGKLQVVVANVIGLPEDEVHALKQQGASFASIAAEQGVDATSVEAAYLAAREGVNANLNEAEAITELQAEQVLAPGTDAFVTLFEREGCGEGQNVTGERLFANQAEMARGPQAGEPVAASQRQARGPRGRW